jgi:hypothetical protein
MTKDEIRYLPGFLAEVIADTLTGRGMKKHFKEGEFSPDFDIPLITVHSRSLDVHVKDSKQEKLFSIRVMSKKRKKRRKIYPNYWGCCPASEKE